MSDDSEEVTQPMRKIPTLFVRDPDDMRHVTRDVHPSCQWVIDGEGVATRKFDGTCVMADGNTWWARREVKADKTPPPNFRPVETDEATGKSVGWEPAEQSAFWKYLNEVAYDRSTFDQWPDGTYELCGPKINRNPEGYERHYLIRHDEADEFQDVPRDYDGLRSWLLAHPEFEGIVWHHPDGRMAKLKRRDFT